MKKWLEKIRVQTLLLIYVILIGTLVALYLLIQSALIRFNVNSRVNEISRYAALIAANISQTESVRPDDENLYAEVDSMSAFYQEARILVLSQQCRVLKDSAGTRKNRTIVNDDILRALSGKSQSHVDDRYGVVAVPVPGYHTNVTDGVVFVSFSIEKQIQKAYSNMTVISAILGIIWIISTVLISVCVIFAFLPLSRIQEWLNHVLEGHPVNAPNVNGSNEYTQVVRSVTSIIDDLKNVDASRKEFVSNVSHELKTPLASIKVLAESVLEEENVEADVYREFLSDINEEIDRESALVEDLLSLVRLEDSQKELNLKQISINDLAESVLKRVASLAEQKNLEMVLENASHVVAEVDEMKMTIAVSNLVENAIKYNKEGGSVHVRVDQDLAEAVISVADTGCGIAEEHFGKIYQRFYRVDKARERAVGGTGLGLAIVHQIVTMHHGSISLQSKVDKGSTFTIRIPLIAVRDPQLMREVVR